MKIKRKADATRVSPVLPKVLIIAAIYLVLTALLVFGITPEQHDIQVGMPAPMDILATKDVNDTVTTDERKAAAANAVEPSYKSIDFSVVGSVSSDMQGLFDQLLALRSSEWPDGNSITDEQLDSLNETLPIKLSREEYAALRSGDEENLRNLFNDTIISVRETLNAALVDGQQTAAINRITRTLATSGYSTDLITLAASVMRNCIRPNMAVDEEITEAARKKAMDEVETVTRIKGEVIVRRGERVTQAQYAMLSSLGLLEEASLDVQLLGGIALVLALLVASVALYLRRYLKKRMSSKNLLLLGLISVAVTALCLGFSRWNAYMMPVALGMMLVALLFDQRAALYLNTAFGIIASLLSDTTGGLFSVTMFSVLLMSMVSGPIILAVFTRRTQRLTTLLAGVLVGISNFLCTLAMGFINSTDLINVLTNALWAMAGGIISAILCIGLQPLLESIFNLATNSKLIELSNPNQPLLRRLLLEAPGTYHHAIIVANLAEAAANAVGANALLARVGAYYHDIGKLKRPGYFKENQLGDNPHDRTDPRVSAAILTAHPRDGVAMAQKARIPEAVLDIIQQHHGDGIALYFYDKAAKLYGSENVDINAFRYEGPRPRTKEAACVMLADTIEAAARSVPDPTPEKIDELIRKLVRSKLNDGQLDESDLTFRDLETICSAFSTVLTGVFHERIEYPDVAVPARSEARAEAPGPEEKPKSAEENKAGEPPRTQGRHEQSRPEGPREAIAQGEPAAKGEGEVVEVDS